MDATGIGKLHVAVFAHEVFQIRCVLEEVRIEFLVIEREVRLYIITELDDLQVNAFLREQRLYNLQDFSVGDGSRADLQDLALAGRR